MPPSSPPNAGSHTPRRERLIGARRFPLAGVLAAAGCVAAATLVIYPLRDVAPAVSTGVIYLLAVLLVSTHWGLWLGLMTAVASAVAFNFFHIPATGRLTIADPENWVALALYLVAAVVASTVADFARSHGAEAERRRQEADLAADMAQILLGGASLHHAVPAAAQRLGEAFALARLSLVVGQAQPEDSAVHLVLHLGEGREAVLSLPAGTDPRVIRRLSARVVPALEALLRAAVDRDELLGRVVETEALRRSDVIKTAVLRAVSHDLRTPLTAIMAAGDAVRSPTLPPGQRDELGALIVAEAGRLSRLVENLLDLSRLEAGAAAPRPDWCSVEEVVQAAVDHLAERDAAIRTDVCFEGDLPLVRADGAQLERVFVNLLENAHRFSDGRSVQVRGSLAGDTVDIRVIDHGRGLPTEQIERLFEPFVRGPAGDGHHGTGLGLAIVKGFLEANGGRVRAESPPAGGTVFTVELPLAPSAPPAALEVGRA